MTADLPQPDTSATRSSASGKAQAVVAHYTRTRERLDRTAAGHMHRRIVEVDLTNQAMILAALAFMLLIPVLVSLAAVVPLGGGVSGSAAERLGLSAEATRDVQQLFPAPTVVRGATTFFGTLFTVASAFSWPTALQRGYELAWGLPSLGWRSLWRPLLWLVTFVVVGALFGGAGPLVTGWLRTLLLIVVGLPLTIAWAWWTQRLLLGGRIGWRQLLPGAIAIGVGLVALRLLAGFYLSTSITQHFHQYGPLGIVFILLSWLVALSTVMLGGAVLGAALHEHRLRRAEQAGEGLSPAAGDAAGPVPDLASPRDDFGS
jgi:membrane protein